MLKIFLIFFIFCSPLFSMYDIDSRIEQLLLSHLSSIDETRNMLRSIEYTQLQKQIDSWHTNNKKTDLLKKVFKLREVRLIRNIIRKEPRLFDEYGNTLLYYLIETPMIINHSLAQWLLTEGIDSNVYNRFGYTALHYAIIEKDLKIGYENLVQDVIDILVQNKDTNLNNPTQKLAQTPLHLAVQEKNANLIHTLLDKKVLVDQKDRNGKTPLRYLVDLENTSTQEIISFIELFLHCGANIHSKDNENRTILDSLVYKWNNNLIKFFLKKTNISLQECFNNGKQLLFQYLWNNPQVDQEIVTLLFEKAQQEKIAFDDPFCNQVN
ncbi:MAG: ankyrin repeat domain-containing protein [Candidatus Babeliales bacterium]